MIFGQRLRALTKLAYTYNLKDKTRISKENWRLAEILLEKLEKGYRKNK